MTWTLLLGLVSALGVALGVVLARRRELVRMESSVRDRERAVRGGSAEARLQYPEIDLSRCLGCGTCVAACPEGGVLDLVHGQAVVVNGARCQGISACERECPTGAITITVANIETRRDVPALDDLEAIGTPGLFLAGEVTAHALIKTAIDHGAAVVEEVARRAHSDTGSRDPEVFDLCIVGAGPAGLAASLEAKRQGLRFVTLEQEDRVGGTVGRYPRRKLVMTRPVSMPLVGRLPKTTYLKEELVDLWQEIAEEQRLPIHPGQVFEGVDRQADGTFHVRTRTHTIPARFVCLALGRRGTPRRLGVPGEELPKVAYSLLDANSYRGRKLLVVGGGDSAVEAALGLADQEGNEVTLAHRREGFPRIRAKNEERLLRAASDGRIGLLTETEVTAIHPNAVELARGPARTPATLENDEVFVMAGGVAPFESLERAGVSFDPSLRPKSAPIEEQGTGALRALAIGFGLAFAALLFALWHADYYLLPSNQRPAHPKHAMLRPGLGVGLAFGIASASLVLVNLSYLLRRSPRVRFDFGSLQTWMTSHVATGILAFLCALLHGAMSPRDTVGGHAFWALTFLIVTGAIGRYFYAWIPRAANGRELELAEVKAKLARLSDDWERDGRRIGARVRDEVFGLIEERRWRGTFFGRVLAIFGVRRDLDRVLARVTADARNEGIGDEELEETLRLARDAHRTGLMAAHYEDLRAVLDTWRYFHRWVSALMVLLVVVHVAYALIYGAHYGDAG